MLRFVWLALVVSVLLPSFAHAQAAPATQQGFGFCTVTDNSSAQIKIWASPVFPLESASDDHGASRRTIEVANEFLAHVGTLGGTGTKICLVLPTQAEAEAFREEQRAPWSKRMYFIKLGDWRDVAWTPAPLKPGAAAASDAPVTRYFLCHAMQMDFPDRSALSRTVASGVFVRPVPAGSPSAMYDQAKVYATQFQAIVQAHGLPVQGDCMPYDSAGEAQYAYQQMKRLADGFNQEYTEVAWTPQAQALSAPVATTGVPAPAANAPTRGTLGVKIGPVSAELAQGLGRSSTEGAWVVEVLDGGAAKAAGIQPMDLLLKIAGQAVSAPTDVGPIISRLRPGFEAPVQVWRDQRLQTVTVLVPGKVTETTEAPAIPAVSAHTAAPVATMPPAAAASASATTAEAGYFCFAFVTRTEPPLVVQAPIHREADTRPTDGVLTSSLRQLVQAVQTAYPGKWHDGLMSPVCYDNSMVFPGETFCVASTHKHFSGSQMLGMFCNASRDTLEKRFADHRNSSGTAAVQVLDWP